MKRIHLSGLQGFAREVLESISPRSDGAAFVVALSGDLGAGKTTFMQALARELDIIEPVQSPTYVLMRSYPISSRGFRKLVHIDAYRLESAAEFKTLHPDLFLNDPSALVCVEWPERIGEMLPKPDILITLRPVQGDPDVRDVEIEMSSVQ